MFQYPGWMRKSFIPRNFSWRVATETWDASCFKKGLLEEQQECSKHLRHIAIEKDILSELNRCIFQISLKYIKLVIPKILFMLVLDSFIFYFKITWPLPHHTKIKISDPRPPPPPPPHLHTSKEFSEIFNPPKLEGLHALFKYFKVFNSPKIFFSCWYIFQHSCNFL